MTVEQLDLPPIVKDIAMTKRGLVLVGATETGEIHLTRGDDRSQEHRAWGTLSAWKIH